jgi:ubiquinone/menaquinone biosynthesis C-methylase UbiE
VIFEKQRQHWDAFAHLDPYWAVLSDPAKRGGGWTGDEFYATGRDFVRGVMDGLWRLGLPERLGTALDVGCGPGRNTHALAAYFDSVVGYDISPQMLELARAKQGETYFTGNTNFVLNDTDDLAPFKGGEFDMVFSFITLQHIDIGRVPFYLSECWRVLKPGGTFVFQYISHPNGRPGSGESGPDPEWEHEGVRPFYEVNPVRVDNMVHLLLELGFEVVQVQQDAQKGQSFYSYDYVVRK